MSDGQDRLEHVEPDDARSRAAIGEAGRREGRDRFRKFWLDAHLGIGLVAGAIFVIVGLSGSLLAFRVEIDEWLNPDLLNLPTVTQTDASRHSYDELIAASKAAAPAGGVASFVHFPKHAEGYFDVIYAAPGAGGHDNVYQIVMDPRTAAVIGRRALVDTENQFAEPFINIVTHVHYTLLQGALGENIVGFAGLFLFASLGSGLYLWWPRNGKWRQAFAIKRHASAERFVLDLHKTVGVYSCIVLLVMVFSGIYLIFMPQVRALVGLVSSTSAHAIHESLKSGPADGRAPIGVDAAVAVVDRLFPDGKLMNVALPGGVEGVYLIGKRADDEVSRSEPARQVAVDQYSGAALHVQDPHDFTAGERFLEWQYPLHNGEAFGVAGRAFVSFMGFVPALLFTTGVTRWLQKRRAKYANSRRKAS